MWMSYPISPNSHSRPGAQFVEPLHGGLVGLRVGYVANELRILQESRHGLQSWNLEIEGRRFEAVGTRGVRSHSIGDHVAIH